MSLFDSIKNKTTKFFIGFSKIGTALGLVFFKTSAGAGQAIFGVKKQLDFVGLASDPGETNIVETAYTGVVVSFTIVTSVLTRGGNTCRTILGRYYLYDYVFNPLGYNDPELDLRRAQKKAREEAQRQQILPAPPAIAEDKIPSRSRIYIYVFIDSAISTISVASSLFASISTYNFGRHFMEYISDQEIKTASYEMSNFMVAGAWGITLANLFSNLNWNSKKARRNGTTNAMWLTNLELDEHNRLYYHQYNHKEDLHKWAKAIAFMAPNCIINEPANAFFTTEDAMLVTPAIKDTFAFFFDDPEKAIFASALTSSGAVIMQTGYTNIPALQAFLIPHPEIEEALAEIAEKHPFGHYLYVFGLFCGAEDSLVTIFSFIVAICYTMHRFDPDDIATQALWLLLAAIACATAKGKGNYEFSVKSALWDLLEDIYPLPFEKARDRAIEKRRQAFLAKQNLVEPQDERQELADEITAMMMHNPVNDVQHPPANAKAKAAKQKKKKAKAMKQMNPPTYDELYDESSAENSSVKSKDSKKKTEADEEDNLPKKSKKPFASTFKYINNKLNNANNNLYAALLDEDDLRIHSEKSKKHITTATHRVFNHQEQEVELKESEVCIDINDINYEDNFSTYVPPISTYDADTDSKSINDLTGSPWRKPVVPADMQIPPLSLSRAPQSSITNLPKPPTVSPTINTNASLFGQQRRIVIQSEPVAPTPKAVYGKLDKKNKNNVVANYRIRTFDKVERITEEKEQKMPLRTPKSKRKPFHDTSFDSYSSGLSYGGF